MLAAFALQVEYPDPQSLCKFAGCVVGEVNRLSENMLGQCGYRMVDDLHIDEQGGGVHTIRWVASGLCKHEHGMGAKLPAAHRCSEIGNSLVTIGRKYGMMPSSPNRHTPILENTPG